MESLEGSVHVSPTTAKDDVFFSVCFLISLESYEFCCFLLENDSKPAFGACQRFAGNSQPRFGWSSGRAG